MLWDECYFANCLVTPRNGMHLRCNGSEATAQLILIKRERMPYEEPGAPCHQASFEATISKVFMLLWWSVASHKRKNSLYSVSTVRPRTLPPLCRVRFHSQTACSHKHNDWFEPGSAPGSWHGTDLGQQQVITLASQFLNQAQLVYLFVSPGPLRFPLQPMHNDAFSFLSWKDLRAVWTYPRHR